MRKIFDIFKVKREERWLAIVMLLALVALNALVLCKYYDMFTPLKKWYWPLFIRNFHISGFDPITYSVVSDWTAGYNVFRHPLLAFYMYVPYLLNQALMWLTGKNCAIFIVAAIQIFCAFYSALFLSRILREIVGTTRREATMLTLYFFSFGYVMVSAIVPDHFIMSMMLLLLALYVSGRRMKSGRELKMWQTVVYFFLTAGTSLNNGLKIFLSALFVNRRRFFRPAHLLLAVLLPAAVIWGVSRVEYAKLVWPREMAQKKANAEKKAAKERKERELRLLQARRDSIAAASKIETEHKAMKADGNAPDTLRNTQRPAAIQKNPAPRRRQRQGRPISNEGFMRWTDITTSRVESVVENLFGESIQLHQKHLLEDEYRCRPMIVRYSSPLNYAVEALVVLLFAAGVWFGRRSRFLWLCMSYFALDMLLHVGLGFGLNEVYIMTAHWAFVIPIAGGYLLRASGPKARLWLTSGVWALALWLAAYNATLIVGYCLNQA